MNIENYLELVGSFEKWHTLFLTNLKKILHLLKVKDINAAQTLLICSIGKRTLYGRDFRMELLHGRNPTYNLKSLVENKYIVSIPCSKDKRMALLKVSVKGEKLRDQLLSFFHMQLQILEKQNIHLDQLQCILDQGRQLENLWSRIPYAFYQAHMSSPGQNHSMGNFF